MTIMDTNKIEELLASKVSAYEIEKRSGVTRNTISKLRTKKQEVMKMSLESANKLQKFWEEYTMVKQYFDGSYDLFVLEGNTQDRRRAVTNALHVFLKVEELSEELENLVDGLRQEALNDSERLYLSFDNIAADAKEFDEIPTGGEMDNGKESVVLYKAVELESRKNLYILLTYDL